MRILHIVRNLGDGRAVETARKQSGDHEVTLLLLHDAVLDPPPFEGKVYACLADVEARSRRGDYETVDYRGIVRLVAANDRIVSW